VGTVDVTTFFLGVARRCVSLVRRTRYKKEHLKKTDRKTWPPC